MRVNMRRVCNAIRCGSRFIVEVMRLQLSRAITTPFKVFIFPERGTLSRVLCILTFASYSFVAIHSVNVICLVQLSVQPMFKVFIFPVNSVFSNSLCAFWRSRRNFSYNGNSKKIDIIELRDLSGYMCVTNGPARTSYSIRRVASRTKMFPGCIVRATRRYPLESSPAKTAAR